MEISYKLTVDAFQGYNSYGTNLRESWFAHIFRVTLKSFFGGGEI